MLPELLSMRDKLIPGMYPSSVDSASFLWSTASNVLFVDEGVTPGWKQTLVRANTDAPIRGLHGQRTATLVQILFFGTLSKLWRSVAMASPVDVSNGTYTTQADEAVGSFAGHWSFINWGEWVLASNGKEQIQIYKSGPAFAALTQTGGSMPFTFARVIIKSGPHVLALNTSNAPNEVWWCTADDVHDWIITANNSAGNYILRDLESEIVAAVPLGERIAIYAADSLHIGTYIGTPFVFGFHRIMDGIGAVGIKAVCSVGRLNYGLGPQGFFMTDGTQVLYIDEPQIRKYFLNVADLAQLSKTVCYHNEKMNRVEWFYKLASGNVYEGLAYDYRLKAWSHITDQFTAALEKDVFSYPLVAKTTGDIQVVGSGTATSSTLTSKPLDFGSPQHGKFVSHVYFNYTGAPTVEIGYHNELNGAITWMPSHTLNGDGTPIRVGITARYFRVRITGASDYRVGGIVFYGRGGGTHK